MNKKVIIIIIVISSSSSGGSILPNIFLKYIFEQEKL